MRPLAFSTLSLPIFLCLGCSPDAEGGGRYGASETSDGASDAGTTTGSGTNSSSGADGGDSGPILDVGGQSGTATAGDGGGGEGCDFVDLLFVIDNSASMGSHQEALAAAFPGFVDEMFESLPEDTDLHVGITTTSFFDGSCSEATIDCASASSEAEILQHYDPPGAVNNGENGGQGRLFVHDGKAYFEANTSDDPAALKGWFSAAAVAAGEDGCSFEMAAAGAGWAVAPENASSNEGFLRDEGAALMIFVVTDEPDKSPGDVDTHVQRVLDAKSGCGGANCIVVGGLVPDSCYDHPNDRTLYDFMNAFGEPPVFGFMQDDDDVTPDYSGVLGPGLAQILGQACEDIPPVD